ncbi:LCP family protein [Streptacidiphilus anmyonensis]|uniref:LCP family protein n=1 Tax=Streptacidiphilus anmyonensis TaxID=405782 RepID=UPI000A022C94|nr:LCP family protein [Streptacidiphilus anmyonensis]
MTANRAAGQGRRRAGSSTADGAGAPDGTGGSHGSHGSHGSRGSTAVGGRAAARRGRRKSGGTKHKGLKIAGAIVLSLAVIGAAGTYYVVHSLDSNITSSDLCSGSTCNTKEKVDAFGRSPINILLIGSDARDNQADCNLGGDCGSPGARADVEMVLHVSADRSNATVMSIPRDLEATIPKCDSVKGSPTQPAHTDMINAALNWGPGCSVAAVQQLTGIHIDHFMTVDFSGVVAMSDAVGGVNICVDKNVYDPYSHLKLSAGTHTLKGVSALEFVRTRHGFGDGGDLGRTYAQHLFISNMVKKMKSAGTLTDIPAMYSLAQAATKALTVDTSLNSVFKLAGLGEELSGISMNNITFLTMQTLPDPANNARLITGPGAQSLFDSIANDQSLTEIKSKSGASPSATASPVNKADVAVKVENGTGVTGRASALSQKLIGDGFSQNTVALSGPSAATTTLTYPAGKSAEAQAVAKDLGLKSTAVKQSSVSSSIVLLIGADWTSGTTFPGGSAVPAPANTKAALTDSHAQTANESSCAQVSTFDTVSLPGYGGMTPTRAYALSPKVANSAP